MNIKRYINNTKLLFALLFAWLIIASVAVILINKVQTSKEELKSLLKEIVQNEAIAHYNSIVTARTWNASHGGIYILEHDGIKPNQYLKNNILKTDDNKTLIKVNPAWMTRQISDISNASSNYYYKMTSLNPINPINKADAFEKKALEYFEKNKEQKYFMHFKDSAKEVGKFNFMGSLKVTQPCLSCHAEQGYKVGDIRGGIRISLPLQNYQDSLSHLDKKSFFNKAIIIIFALIFAALVSIYLRKIYKHQEELKNLNAELEKKVELRTQELSEINSTLKERVAKELQENRKKDETMLTQARYVAMGEMLQMIAHQWRQPISIIGLHANNLLVDIELGTDDKQSVKNGLIEISEETQQLSKIITEVTELFTSDSTTDKLLPQSICDEALSVMQESFDEHLISVEKIYTNETQTILMPRELFQVYWNILNNAKDILIERAVSNPLISIEIFENANEIVTKISDNAGGIDEENMSKIFEPYFSTNSNLNGKGLGLYVAKIITEKNLLGSLSVNNTSEGAVFSISIPKNQ